MKALLLISLLAFPIVSVSSQEAIRVIRSDSGRCEFQGADVQILVSLLSDYQKTLKEWDRPDSAEIPKIETKTKFVTGDTVVPFVTFASKKGLNEPLFVDADLVMPDGSISPSDHSPGVVLGHKIQGDGNLYREENLFGFGISNRYPAGNYFVRLKIYSSSVVFCVFEESFQLN